MGLCIAGYTHQHCRGGGAIATSTTSAAFTISKTANTHPNRETPVVSLLVPGANHNFFNTTVQQDDYYRQPDNAPLCNPQQSTLRLSRVEQENFSG